MKPLVQSTQINKCPHGFPVGTCPICSGKGSMGSSDRNKPRKKGEMSYNECLAQWNRMKALKQNKLNEQKLLSSARLNQNSNRNLLKNNLLNKFFSMVNFLKSPFIKGANLISKTFSNVLNNTAVFFQKGVNFIQNIFSKINQGNFFAQIRENLQSAVQGIFQGISQKSTQFLNSVIEKLSSFLGIEKSFEEEKDEKSLKRALKKTFVTVLSLFMEQNSDDREDDENQGK